MVRHFRVQDPFPAGVRQCRPEYSARAGNRQFRPGAGKVVCLGGGRNTPHTVPGGVFRRAESYQLPPPGEFDRLSGFRYYHLSGSRAPDSIGRASGVLVLNRSALRRVVPFALPFVLPLVSIAAALIAQGALQQIVPKGIDFPYAFFYLIAAFVSAWYGGYLSGALACLLTMVGLPLLGAHGSLPHVDLSRLAVFTGVSLLISRVSRSERRAREILRSANDELDQRVRNRTQELVLTVEQLQSEIAGHRRTETALRESEDRAGFTLE